LALLLLLLRLFLFHKGKKARAGECLVVVRSWRLAIHHGGTDGESAILVGQKSDDVIGRTA
jgi:hypothetical protein